MDFAHGGALRFVLDKLWPKVGKGSGLLSLFWAPFGLYRAQEGLLCAGGKSPRNLNIGIFGQGIVPYIIERLLRKMQ